MKVNGVSVTAPKPEIVVIPREGGNLVFTCKCVTDYEPFEKLCPKPTAPIKIMAVTGDKSLDYEDKEFVEAINNWSSNQHFFMLISSIKDCVEFDIIKLNDPKTWNKMDEEFKKVNIIGVEYSAIITGILSANGLNSKRLEEAKESFLAEREAKEK